MFPKANKEKRFYGRLEIAGARSLSDGQKTSKKQIFKDDFEEGQEYIIYYDEYSKVIVKVEIVEQNSN